MGTNEVQRGRKGFEERKREGGTLKRSRKTSSPSAGRDLGLSPAFSFLQGLLKILVS